MVDPGSIRSISTSNERQLSSSLWEERVGWYMNLITPIRSPHWPLWRSSSSISPLYSSSSSSFLPLSISSFSPISCSVLNKTNRSDLPKRLQILTDCQAVHSPLTSPFFCHFFFFPPPLLWSIQMSVVVSVSGLMMYDKLCVHFLTSHYCICIPPRAVCIHAGLKGKRCHIR